MAKRLLSALVVLLLLAGCALTEGGAQPADLSALSVEELLALRQQIEDELIAKGYVLYYDLERGSKGDAVLKVQERLAELGYYAGPISAKYTTETQKAFKQFEKANGLDNDGLASRKDQLVLFGAGAIAKAMPTPKPTRTAAPEEGDHSEYGEFQYMEYMRHPENYIGEKVVLKGRVLQVLGSRKSGFEIRLATSSSDNVVYVYIKDDPGYNLLEDDRLTVYATLRNTITYEALLGQEITIPSANADSIVLR